MCVVAPDATKRLVIRLFSDKTQTPPSTLYLLVQILTSVSLYLRRTKDFLLSVLQRYSIGQRKYKSFVGEEKNDLYRLDKETWPGYCPPA